ncbi:MAG TPA: outer membrane beta-barrel protein [Verrucomicrobiae bacterium]
MQNKEKQLTINKQHRRNQMKFNKWTVGLAAVGAISLVSAARADEKMSQVQTALSNTTISGYVDTSAMWNLGSQNGGLTPKYTPGGVNGDGFNLNAIDIALDKPEDAGPWASGYHVELMYGPDAVGTPSIGNVRQAYVTLRTPVGANGIDWKVGVFDTIIGYESSTDGANPNFTRSYGYQLEPTTETGILGTYKINDIISVSAGMANSGTAGAVAASGNALAAGPGNPAETQKTYLGSIALTAPDSWGWAKGATLNAGVIDALNAQGAANAGNTWYYAGVTVPTPISALKVGSSFDYTEAHNATALNHSDDSSWDAALYTTYQASDKLSLNLRGEYLDDGAAQLYAAGPGGTRHEATEVTATVQYQLWANVLSRVELRWDHVGAKAYNATAAGAGPVDENAFLLALNLIYQF